MSSHHHKPNVIVTETLAQKCAAWLNQKANVIFCHHENADELDSLLSEADALIVRTYTQINDDILGKCRKLKVVARAGVGLDNIDFDACQRRGIPVVYTPDANTQAVAEYVLGLILDEFRPRISLMYPLDKQAFHQLRQTAIGRQLDQLTLGIVGLGRIGKRLGKIAHSIGMNLRICDLLPEAELRKSVDLPFAMVDHEQLYANCDIISLHVDGRPDNRHMINREMLRRFNSDCLLINTSRGMVIDHEALCEWAQANPAARIVLDVHDPEPPPPDYPPGKLNNVRLLPHIAARTDMALENMSWVVRDVAAVLEGHRPQYPAYA